MPNSPQYEISVSLCGPGSVPVSRSCTYQFCLQGGSVFADFTSVNSDGKSTLQLVRISFDGYGCCACSSRGLLMNSDDAETLIRLIPFLSSSEEVEQQVGNLLGQFFESIKGAVWEDALLEHGLILPKNPEE